MATKLFLVDSPERLKELRQFCKDGSVMNLATVWSTAKRKSGKTPWDGKIFVSFYTEGRMKFACVARASVGDELKEVAWLKYNPALDWCYVHLNLMETGKRSAS